MRSKRAVAYIVAITLAALACYTVFITKPFAQGMPGAPGGMPGAPGGGMPGAPGGGMPGAPGGGMPGAPGGGMPGMPGGMGGGMMGGGGGSQAQGDSFTWTEADMPDELKMTYAEFLASEAQAAVPLPDVYLMSDNGVPKRYTRNQWLALARIYAEDPVKNDRLVIGQPGGKLWQNLYVEAAVKHNEMNAMWSAWASMTEAFTFEVGYPRLGTDMRVINWSRKDPLSNTPRWGRWEGQVPNDFQITVPVVMKVKKNVVKNWGQRFLNIMKPYDNMGNGRSPFMFMTYENGAFRPHTLYLANETIEMWRRLWTLQEVQLLLFDAKGQEMFRSSNPAPISGDVFTQVLTPPTIYHNPRYKLLLAGDDSKFNGSKLNLNGTEGWYYEFSFTLSKAQLMALDGAKSRLSVNGGPPSRMRYLPGYTAGSGGSAGGGMAMAGGGAPGFGGGPGGMPGMAGGMPGMGGGMPGMMGGGPGGPGGMPGMGAGPR